mmetsp:Transcript_6878/g.10134  ORF Transcript_6878/g.10134 Transcript_6878/m.10134 type:complete len:306 (+) Transcript_6878:1449-2366(+)
MAICTLFNRIIYFDSSISTELIHVIGDLLQCLYRDGGGVHDDGSSDSSSDANEAGGYSGGSGQTVSSWWWKFLYDDSDKVKEGNQYDSHHQPTNDFLRRRRRGRHVQSNDISSRAPSSLSTPSSSSSSFVQQPNIADVLAVNLLHLLEGIATVRLCQQQQQSQHPSSSSLQHNQQQYHNPSVSKTASDLLHEIKVACGYELVLPIQICDLANFYYKCRLGQQCKTTYMAIQKKIQQQQQQNNKMAAKSLDTIEIHKRHKHDMDRTAAAATMAIGKGKCLDPGGKIMLRLFLFDLIQRLSLYHVAC